MTGSVEELNAYVNLQFIRAQQLVNHHWNQIAALAQALMERSEISGVQSVEIIRQAVRTEIDGLRERHQ